MGRNPFDAASSVAVKLAQRQDINPIIAEAFGGQVQAMRRRFSEMRDPSVRRQMASLKNTVYKALRFLGNAVSSLDRGVVSISFELDEDSREKRVVQPFRQHRLTQILGKGSFAQPNPWTSAGNYLENIVWDLGLSGNHYSLKVRNPAEGNRVWWLIRLRPDWMKVVADENNIGIAGYVLRPTGMTLGEISGSFGDFGVKFDKSQIVHVRNPNPLDDRIGYSPLRAMAASVASDDEIRKYNATFFEQGARIDGVITGAVTTKQVEEVYDMMVASHYSGTEAAWLPLVLPDQLKFTATQQSLKDMEWATLAEKTSEDILEAYGVPRGLLGTVTDVNRANLQGLQVIAAQNGVLPITRRIEEHLEADCLNRTEEPQQTDDAFFEFDFEDPTPADPETEIKARESDLKTGVRVINEFRAEDGLAPKPWGDAPWFPAALIQPGTGEEEELELEDGDAEGD